MKLQPIERNLLVKMRLRHDRTPTWDNTLPKVVGLVAALVVLVLAFAVLAGGLGSPLVYYSLGLVTFFPVLAFVLLTRLIRLHRIRESIIDWQRVDTLLAADREGV